MRNTSFGRTVWTRPLSSTQRERGRGAAIPLSGRNHDATDVTHVVDTANVTYVTYVKHVTRVIDVITELLISALGPSSYAPLQR